MRSDLASDARAKRRLLAALARGGVPLRRSSSRLVARLIDILDS